MKRISTLLLSTLFSLSLLAYDGTRLTVSSVSNMKMTVEVDGRRYNMNNKAVSIRDLSAGHHNVKIYRDRKNNNNSRFNNRQELIYSGSVYLRRDYHLDITINRFGKALVDERRIDRNDDWYDDDDNYDRDNRWNDRDPRDNRDNGWNNGSNRAMNINDFNQAKETLRREWLESSRLNLAMQIFDRNYYTTQQVKEILQLFSFENNKLDLAKHAYARTTDKGNYTTLNDVFSQRSSRDELARYIRNYR
jgi:hypothetical protein